jgi:hypothetical protein
MAWNFLGHYFHFHMTQMRFPVQESPFGRVCFVFSLFYFLMQDEIVAGLACKFINLNSNCLFIYNRPIIWQI